MKLIKRSGKYYYNTFIRLCFTLKPGSGCYYWIQEKCYLLGFIPIYINIGPNNNLQRKKFILDTGREFNNFLSKYKIEVQHRRTYDIHGRVN